MNEATKGPIIVWLNYGAYEGWRPTSYNTIKEALEGERYNSEFVITKLAQYTVVDNTNGP